MPLSTSSSLLPLSTETGTWATEIANAQPFADVLGVDIDWEVHSPGTSQNGNIDFSTVDVTRPLPWGRDQFDLIHIKGLLLDMPSYSQLIERLAMVLRPGGMLVIVESEPAYRSAAGSQLPASLRTWDACVREAYASKGIDVSTASRLVSSVAASGVFSSSPYCQQLGLPLGGYMRGDSYTLQKAGQLHSRLVASTLKTMVPSLVEHGYSKLDIDQLLQSVLAELGRPEAKYFQRLFAVYATKNPS
ncbi:hypothetical protein I316_07795 [Kwoniella heveanensis BCC8398]|uniref:Methyltransferase domain-containing protein n=1 Tax=Kwoniella heveanensis BCC8398 TaxID=1296120 RepID=A0A1B9GHQ5_9TREE|nr:hypothetical protein I316_07795 [Kwoniella heveanensis BCC8398]